MCAGRTRQSVRLLPVSAIESGETKNVITKVTETEGELAHLCTWKYMTVYYPAKG